MSGRSVGRPTRPAQRPSIGSRCAAQGRATNARTATMARDRMVRRSYRPSVVFALKDAATIEPRAHTALSFRPMRRTLKQIMAEYGAVAVVLYLVIFTLVLLGSWAAI